MNKYAEIEKCIETISRLETEAAVEIREELVKRLGEKNPEITISKPLVGIIMEHPARNDRRDYVWLAITIEKKEYWIALFLNDLDEATGNPHTQFGRIQFAHDISHIKIKDWCGTPNELLADGRSWKLCPEKLFDPNLKLYDEDYSPKLVVDLFIGFLVSCGAKFNL